MLGPNGAGKTTLFNVIAGDITPPRDGLDQGRRLHVAAVASPAELGVARTYQKTRLFPGLTVEDNLYLAQSARHGSHRRCAAADCDERRPRTGTPRAANASGSATASITVVGDLSHGQQRQLEVGMASSPTRI